MLYLKPSAPLKLLGFHSPHAARRASPTNLDATLRAPLSSRCDHAVHLSPPAAALSDRRTHDAEDLANVPTPPPFELGPDGEIRVNLSSVNTSRVYKPSLLGISTYQIREVKATGPRCILEKNPPRRCTVKCFRLK